MGSPAHLFSQPQPVCSLKLPSHLPAQVLPTSPGVLKPGSGMQSDPIRRLSLPSGFEICILEARLGLFILGPAPGHLGPPPRNWLTGERHWFCTSLEDGVCGQRQLQGPWAGQGTLCSCPGHGSSFPSQHLLGSPAAGTTGQHHLCSGWQSPPWAGGSHWDGERRKY